VLYSPVWGGGAVQLIKKNPWIVLVGAFVILIVIGIAVS
jgi:hypothetical protein